MTKRTRTTDVGPISRAVVDNVMYFRKRLQPSEDPEQSKRWAELETFIAVALKVMEQTNPSKLREIARTLEIKARLHGVEVFEE